MARSVRTNATASTRRPAIHMMVVVFARKDIRADDAMKHANLIGMVKTAKKNVSAKTTEHVIISLDSVTAQAASMERCKIDCD